MNNYHSTNTQLSAKDINSSTENILITIKVSKYYNWPSSSNWISNGHHLDTIDDKCVKKEKEINKNEKENKKINEKNPIDEEIKNPSEYQIEGFPYDKAIKYDKRNFGKTYIYSIFS